jgi:nucleotide-binding universal stress UspA family protein
MFKRILVPTDGSDISQKSVQTAVQLAVSVGAEIHTLCVKEPFPYGAISEMQPTPPQEFFDAQERIATRHVAAVAEACAQAKVPCTALTVEGLHPWECIIAHAQRTGCDLIVMASHGRSGVSSLLLGSDSQKVLTHTRIPLLIVR